MWHKYPPHRTRLRGRGRAGVGPRAERDAASAKCWQHARRRPGDPAPRRLLASGSTCGRDW